MSQPVVSAIITTYNRADLVQQKEKLEAEIGRMVTVRPSLNSKVPGEAKRVSVCMTMVPPPSPVRDPRYGTAPSPSLTGTVHHL